jgi:hypothetical protein
MTLPQCHLVSQSLQGWEALCILYDISSGHFLTLAMNPVFYVLPKLPNTLEMAVTMHRVRSQKGGHVVTLCCQGHLSPLFVELILQWKS